MSPPLPNLLCPTTHAIRLQSCYDPLLAIHPLTNLATIDQRHHQSGTPPLLPIPLPTSSLPLLLPYTDNKRIEDPYEITEEIPATDVAKLGQRNIICPLTVRQREYILRFYGRLDMQQDDQLCDAIALVGLVHSMDASDIAYSEAQLAEALTLLRTLQTQMAALQSQQTPTRDPAYPDVPEEAGRNLMGIIFSYDLKKMAPTRRTIRASPATITTTTLVTNAQLKALIDQGVSNTLAACDADRSQNGDDSHNSGTGSRRTEQTARECTYTDFLKFQPMNFKGTEELV
ncbi:hypothetical protein Tco_0726401 [Tanacetum coccineum]|uniref:Uncharacterized protein n=1 Tax=Tanacetum coccineum TaxID=301880 RepID=A0ABQ4YGD0_9ASTR